jgi:hypothetical protein
MLARVSRVGHKAARTQQTNAAKRKLKVTRWRAVDKLGSRCSRSCDTITHVRESTEECCSIFTAAHVAGFAAVVAFDGRGGTLGTFELVLVAAGDWNVRGGMADVTVAAFANERGGSTAGDALRLLRRDDFFEMELLGTGTGAPLADSAIGARAR